MYSYCKLIYELIKYHLPLFYFLAQFIFNFIQIFLDLNLYICSYYKSIKTILIKIFYLNSKSNIKNNYTKIFHNQFFDFI